MAAERHADERRNSRTVAADAERFVGQEKDRDMEKPMVVGSEFALAVEAGTVAVMVRTLVVAPVLAGEDEQQDRSQAHR